MNMQTEKTLTPKEMCELRITLLHAVSRISVMRELALDIVGGERDQVEASALAIQDMAALTAMSLDSLNQRINGITAGFTGNANDWLNKIETWRQKEPTESA